jgi:hypothetical protein
MKILFKWSIRLIFFANTALICLVFATFLSFKIDRIFIEKKIITLQNIFISGHSFTQAFQQLRPSFEKLVVSTDTADSSRICFEIKKWSPSQYQNSHDLRKILNYSQMLESWDNLEGCRHIEIIFYSDSFFSGLHSAQTKIQIDTTGVITKTDNFFIF